MKVHPENGVQLTYQELVLILKVFNALRNRLKVYDVELTPSEKTDFQRAIKILTLDP